MLCEVFDLEQGAPKAYPAGTFRNSLELLAFELRLASQE